MHKSELTCRVGVWVWACYQPLHYGIYAGGQQVNAPVFQQLPLRSYSSGATGLKGVNDDCEMRHSRPIEMPAPTQRSTVHDDYSEQGNAVALGSFRH
jgi:hypothetical protein